MKTTIPILAAVALIGAPLAATAQVDVRVQEEEPVYYHHHHHHRHYRTVRVVKYVNGERIVTYRRVYYNYN